MSEVEFAGLVLEDQLLDHLATPEGATAVWRERLNPEVLNESDDTGIALKFVLDYMDERREPPGIAVLAEETGFSEFQEPIAPVDYVIAKFRERYQRQQMKGVIKKLVRLSGEPEEALRYGLDELSRIKMETAPAGTMVTADRLIETVADYRARVENPAAQGFSLGYPAIDDHLGGLRLGELTVVLARPKRYKSWQLTTSACANILAGTPVAVASMELTEKEMRDRVSCQLSGTSWYRFQHKLLTEQELSVIEETTEELAEDRKLVIFRPKPEDRTVATLVATALDAEAEILYIDQLSWFKGAKDEGNWRVIGGIMEELKDAAQHFPIYMAAQYNRDGGNVEGIPDLTKIGLADFIGQTADTLLGIYASKDMLENKILHFGVVEARSFESCAWELKIELTKNSSFRCLNVLTND